MSATKALLAVALVVIALLAFVMIQNQAEIPKITIPFVKSVTTTKSVTQTITMTQPQTLIQTVQITRTKTKTTTLVVTTTTTPTFYASNFIVHRVYVYDYDADKLYSTAVVVNTTRYIDASTTAEDRTLYKGLWKDTIKDIIIKGSNEPEIITLAKWLRKIAGSNDEKFANLAMQVTRFMYYDNIRSAEDFVPTKLPLQTLAEESGICEDYALLYASILRAGGIKVAYISALVNYTKDGIINEKHALVGVPLPVVTAPYKYHSWWNGTKSYSFTYNGTKYYVADVTPTEESFYSKAFVTDIKKYASTFVGEISWDGIKIEDVVPIP